MELFQAVEALPRMQKNNGQEIFIPKNHYTPGFWVLLSAYINSQKFQSPNLKFECSEVEGYSSAIGLNKALYDNDDYKFALKKEGVNYARLVHLRSADLIDESTSKINSCISNLTNNSNAPGIKALKDVIGELHDNVWAHGKSSGFSMAQKTQVPYDPGDAQIEFAIADSGFGFLEEIRRANIQTVSNDKEAINWCIQKGNTTKPPSTDEWAQSLPLDAISSPLPTSIATRTSDQNNHQGLGLFKLMELTYNYSGELCIASGSSVFRVRSGKASFRSLNTPWKGVAISCRLKQSKLNTGQKDSEISPELLTLIEKLGGAQ